MFFTRLTGFVMCAYNKLHKCETKTITAKARPMLFNLLIKSLPVY